MTRKKLLGASVLLGCVAVGGVITAASARATSGAKPFAVTSSLDGKKVLPRYSHWLAHPNVGPAQVAEVDYLIDGKRRWVEHGSPYNYAGDDEHGHLGYLFTSWLTPGQHRFTVVAVTAARKKASDTVIARVLSASAPPAALAGTWTRTMTNQDRQKCDPAFGAPDNCAPAGNWRMIIDKVGIWNEDPLRGGIVTAYSVSGNVLHGYAPIQMVPKKEDGSPGQIRAHGYTLDAGGGIDCNEAGPFTNYRWSTSGNELTLEALDRNCGQQRAIWEGTWTRVG
jgi:hypothetical protein